MLAALGGGPRPIARKSKVRRIRFEGSATLLLSILASGLPAVPRRLHAGRRSESALRGISAGTQPTTLSVQQHSKQFAAVSS
eukprot:1957523-Alexandrium_andersonii.AAC.1